MDLRLATLKVSFYLLHNVSTLKHCAANRKRLFQRCQTQVHIYTTLAFLALLGAPYIYDISSLRVKFLLVQLHKYYSSNSQPPYNHLTHADTF